MILKIYQDGNAWCCVDEDFINIQESVCGFGTTPCEAAIDYFYNLELKEGYENNV